MTLPRRTDVARRAELVNVSLSYSPEDAQDVLDYIEWVWAINAMPDGPWLYEDRDDVALDLWASYAVEEEC